MFSAADAQGVARACRRPGIGFPSREGSLRQQREGARQQQTEIDAILPHRSNWRVHHGSDVPAGALLRAFSRLAAVGRMPTLREGHFVLLSDRTMRPRNASSRRERTGSTTNRSWRSSERPTKGRYRSPRAGPQEMRFAIHAIPKRIAIELCRKNVELGNCFIESEPAGSQECSGIDERPLE